MARLRVPPGRAGLAWLRHRAATAERGADLLERKLRMLRGVRRRLAADAADAARDWTDRVHDSEAWLLRTGLAGGQARLEAATPDAAASVAVDTATALGVRYPAAVTVTLPPEPAAATAVEARRAVRTALVAAGRHAAAARALAVLDAEIAATARRERALRHGWLPLLTDALSRRLVELDERDRDEATRRRLARRPGRPVGPPGEPPAPGRSGTRR
ncbi:hypothetical protein Athai_08950 [Actinocatenispora thailandica]|uniref:V-type ATPase, D subunit n=1 Tax=Actinocatenispora thailandica TaxID=227318 RepID=A0A7R7DL74_9ACTN|nr:V-type ATP synthase subunit D [Actinocatenispora thailandica]BCJ33392.1 hypothetical protein Athai_08950 [Actinocatenispora thailandica]